MSLTTAVKTDSLTGMKQIPLSSQKYAGLVALVDDEDYPRLSQFVWNACIRGRHRRVQRSWVEPDGRHRTEFMHTEIMGRRDGLEMDHINRDGLDNQKVNLRFVKHGQNASNVGRYSHKKSSVYKGVFRRKKRWTALIRKDYHLHCLGTFDTEDEAALAYNAASKKYHGEYGVRNVL